MWTDGQTDMRKAIVFAVLRICLKIGHVFHKTCAGSQNFRALTDFQSNGKTEKYDHILSKHSETTLIRNNITHMKYKHMCAATAVHKQNNCKVVIKDEPMSCLRKAQD